MTLEQIHDRGLEKLYDRNQFVALLADMANRHDVKKTGIDRVLYDAAEKGDVAKCQSCLLNGADPNYVLPFWNHSVLHRAVYMRHHDVVELLLAAGANLHAKSSDLSTALHLACDQNDAISVGILLRYGADPTARTVRDQLPFDIAEMNRCLPVLRVLRCFRLPFEPKKQMFKQLPRGTQIRMRTIVLCHHRQREQVKMTSSHDDDGIWLRDVCFGDLHYWLVGEICAFMWLMEREMPLVGWQLPNEF